MAPFKLHCGTNSGVAFEPAKNSHVAPQWKMLARSYWIDLQIIVGKDDSSGYRMDECVLYTGQENASLCL